MTITCEYFLINWMNKWMNGSNWLDLFLSVSLPHKHISHMHIRSYSIFYGRTSDWQHRNKKIDLCAEQKQHVNINISLAENEVTSVCVIIIQAKYKFDDVAKRSFVIVYHTAAAATSNSTQSVLFHFILWTLYLYVQSLCIQFVFEWPFFAFCFLSANLSVSVSVSVSVRVYGSLCFLFSRATCTVSSFISRFDISSCNSEIDIHEFFRCVTVWVSMPFNKIQYTIRLSVSADRPIELRRKWGLVPMYWLIITIITN